MFKYFKKYKNKKYKNIDKIYLNHLYTGLSGIFMNYCHTSLESKIPNDNYSKVLEIGAGNKPHVEFINHQFRNYYILETSKSIFPYYKKFKKNITLKHYNGKKIPFKNNFFDRIIISHTLEHINYPEDFIFEMMSKLKKKGVLSISLPTDPGFLWRTGRFLIKLFKKNRTLKVTNLEYDYINAIEHVNSIYNLISIIKHNYKDKIIENFLPFKIKSADLNLFYNVHIVK